MNSGHTCIFHILFCTVYFGSKEDNAVTFPHSAQMKHAFLETNNRKSKEEKITCNKENYFRITTSEIKTHIR